MSFINRVRAFLESGERKVSGVAPTFSVANGPGTPRWTPRNFEKFSDEGYQKNAIAHRCIALTGRSIGHIPLCLYANKGGRLVEIEDDTHPLLTLLLRPNPWQGGARFFESVASYFMLHGNAYIEGVSASDNAPPIELYTHRPDRIKVIPHPTIGNAPGIYRYQIAGAKKDWLMDPISGKGPILHWKTFNPRDDWYGQSFLEAGAYAVDQHNEAGAWNQSLLQNSAAPSGAFIYKPDGAIGATLTREQRAQLETDLKERMSGPHNARKPLIADGGLEWQEMGMSPKEMDWLEGKNSSARDICAVLGVPSQMIGIPGSQTFANYEEARLAFYQETVLPLLDSLLDELNHWLVPTFGDHLTLAADLDEVHALAPIREKVWERVTNADWLTTNEKRQATGYDEVDDDTADEILVAAGKVPLSAGLTPDSGSADPAVPDDGVADPNTDNSAGAPADPVDGSANSAPADAVQAAGLNGAQIVALTGIISTVSDGTMDPGAAVAAILLSFPSFDPAKVQEMVDAADAFEPEKPEPIAPPPMPGAQPAPNAPGGKPPVPPKKQLELDLASEGFSVVACKQLAALAYGADE